MPFSTAGLNAAANGIAAAGAYISLHTADPGATGASEVTGGSYARVQTTWAAAAGGQRVGSQVSINVPGGGTSVGWYGIWSALTGGTFLGGFPLPATDTFGNAGQEQVTPTAAISAS